MTDHERIDAAVYRCLLEHDDLYAEFPTRAEIVNATGVSEFKVRASVKRLELAGRVRSVPWRQRAYEVVR